MNQGVELANGKWIKPVDDDDYLHPDCIQEMVKAIAAHHRRFQDLDHAPAAICSCQAIQVDLNEQEVSRTRRTGPGYVYYVPQEDIHYGMLVEVVPFGTPIQVAFQREAFLCAQGWDSEFDTNCDDIDAWIRIAAFGDAIFINRCLAYRTLWSGAWNRTFSLQKRLDTNFLIKQRIYNQVSPSYRTIAPNTDTMRNYLRLHWAMVALKHGNFQEALVLARPALRSGAGWRLFLKSLGNRFGYAWALAYCDTQVLIQQRYQQWWRDRRRLTSSFIAPRQMHWERLKLRLQLAGHFSMDRRWGAALRILWGALVLGLGATVVLPVLAWLERRQTAASAPPPSTSHPWPVLTGWRKSCYERFNPGLTEQLALYRQLAYRSRAAIPPIPISDLRAYTRLQWTWQLIRQGQWQMVGMQGWSALLSCRAWRAWWLRSRHRRALSDARGVRKFVIIEADPNDPDSLP